MKDTDIQSAILYYLTTIWPVYVQFLTEQILDIYWTNTGHEPDIIRT